MASMYGSHVATSFFWAKALLAMQMWVLYQDPSRTA